MNVDTILEDKKYFRQNSKRKQGEENTTIERERESSISRASLISHILFDLAFF